MHKKILTLGLGIICLIACTASGPQKALDNMADAMEKNMPSQFLAHIDMPAYANNYVKNLTGKDGVLNPLNELSNMFGLGNIDNLINSFVDIQNKFKQDFERGVSSGELMAQCRQATTPDCPWVPQSLRDAQIIKINDKAAIAKVTTPSKLTSWLALQEKDNKWLVVGHAVMEANAREEALAQEESTPKQAPEKKSGQGEVKL